MSRALLAVFLVICLELPAAEWHVDAKAGKKGARVTSTISAALFKARPGDTITVAGGTFYESLLLPTGRADAPITLRAATKQRVVISGFRKITGWKKYQGEIRQTDLDWYPIDLYVKATLQPMARLPKAGWFTVQGGDNQTIIDPVNLRGLSLPLAGAEAQILNKDQRFFSVRIAGFNSGRGLLALTRNHRSGKIAPSDHYIVKNSRVLINEPGEWAVEARGPKSYRLYFWPRKAADLKATRAPHGGPVIKIQDARQLRLEGLEIEGSREQGLRLLRAQDIRIERCLVHSNHGDGIVVRDSANVTIARTRVLHNESGIQIAGSHDVSVVESEIGLNFEDGVVVAGDVTAQWGTPRADPSQRTKNVELRRNYIHHHQFWQHPDNIQIFHGVSGLRIVDNLLLAAGQGIMAQEAEDVELSGNVILSSSANLITLGHGSAHRWKFRGNTLGFPGYSLFNFSGQDYRGDDNIYFGSFGNLSPAYAGAGNVFPPAVSKTVPTSEENAIAADPGLKNVPQGHAAIVPQPDDAADLIELRGKTDFWAIGDSVETNWDGVRRQIVSKEGNRIRIQPPLNRKPLSPFYVIANWGHRSDITLDTTPASESPALQAHPKHQVGSKLNVAAYRSGIFDESGQSAWLELPADVRAGLPDPSNLILFNDDIGQR